MKLKQAKTLDDNQLDELLAYVDVHSALPIRDRLVVALSFLAGLRVAEIAKIPLASMTDARGRVPREKSGLIRVFAGYGKKNNEREVPMHPVIRKTLADFIKAYPDAENVAISPQPFRYDKSYAPHKIKPVTPNALTVYIHRLMDNAGFVGASSHSGRRTFGTKTGRRLSHYHQSLHDLQKLLGHARLETTERYLEPTEDTFDLVASL